MIQHIKAGDIVKLKYSKFIILDYFPSYNAFLASGDMEDRYEYVKTEGKFWMKRFTLPAHLPAFGVETEKSWMIPEAKNFKGKIPVGSTYTTVINKERYRINKGSTFDIDGTYYLEPLDRAGKIEKRKANLVPDIDQRGDQFRDTWWHGNIITGVVYNTFKCTYDSSLMKFYSIELIPYVDPFVHSMDKWVSIIVDGTLFRIRAKHIMLK